MSGIKTRQGGSVTSEAVNKVQDGLHLEWANVGQPESVPIKVIFVMFDNRFLLGSI